MVDSDEVGERRLKFYGLGDYANYFQAEKLVAFFENLDVTRTGLSVNEVLELHNAQLLTDNNLLPAGLDQEVEQRVRGHQAYVRKTVAQFFQGLDDAAFGSMIAGLNYQYKSDLLDLLARFKVFERCTAPVVLGALKSNHFRCADILTSRELVRAYDQEVRGLILSNPQHAESVIAKHVGYESARNLSLPLSLTPADSRDLIKLYLHSADLNQNFVQLVTTARISKATGVDAKLKLDAKRVHEKFTKEYFASNEGIKSGCELRISNTQAEEAVVELDGMVAKLSYSQQWLEGHLDYPTILNNFIHLFEWASPRILLNLPAYPNQLGVMERVMGMRTRDNYPVGAAYHLTDQSSFLQVMMYNAFLQAQGIELESVVVWFFDEYLPTELQVDGLQFRPSSPTASYLERCRHLFSEMESVLKQFSLFIENGELDPELLSITSEQIAFAEIPSVLEGKYAYATDHTEIQGILHLLFSDQSPLNYIDENLKGENFVELVTSNPISRNNILDYQISNIDFLIEHGILTDSGPRLAFADVPAINALTEMWRFGVASYWHHSLRGQSAIDEMVSKGWVARRSTLLTSAEASYFNYFLNQSEFSDGPDLRNRYLHGSQANGDDDKLHRQTYHIALRLLVLLVIKINDDLSLRAELAGQAEQQIETAPKEPVGFEPNTPA